MPQTKSGAIADMVVWQRGEDVYAVKAGMAEELEVCDEMS